MPEGACRGSTRKGGRAAEVSRPSSVSSLGALGGPMASDPLSGSCTSMNTLCSDSDRPASLSSSASSASLQDQPGAFGSSSSGGGLGGCPTAYPHQNGSDISLDLTPVALLDGAAEGQGRWSPGPARAREPRGKKHSHLERVVQEIVETEQAYVRDLRSLVEDYLGCIIDCGKLPLKPEQVGTLFCNIEDIYEFNSELLANMERHPSPHAVAECFVQRSEEFDIYTLYCMNYPSSISVLRQCMEDEVLAKFFRERQATLSHSLPLETYLLKPVQRILKYHLLLQELVKHYDKSSPGYDTVEEASITMTAVAWYINDMKRKQEQAARLQEIQGLLMGWNGPELGAFGELILEGQFRVPRVRKERVFFLLSKVILITKRRGEAFIYKSHIFCCNLALQEATKDPLSFKISDLSIPKHQHLVQVRNQEEKRLWVHYLKHLIVENHPGSIPQKAKQVLLENSFQGAPEGLRGSEAPKRPLPSPRLEERQACTRNRRQSEPPEFMYSPERARRSCPVLALEKSASCRRDHRRKSDPAKEFQTPFHPKKAAKFEAGDEVCSRHMDSNCHLCPPPRPPTAALASGRAKTGAAESDQDEGDEAEFLLPEEAIPSGLSITEEILELLSQRGLDKEARKDGNFPEGGSRREDQPLTKSVLEERKEEAEEEEEEEEEEGESQLGPSLGDAPHLLPEPPPRLHPHFASEDSSEDEEQLLRPQEGGSSSPSPLHVLETLAPEEDSGRAEETPGWEATGWKAQTPQDTDRSACSPQSTLAQRSSEEMTGVKAGGRAGPGPPLTKSDWLLMEKIRSYYEAAEHTRKAPEGPGRKESGPPVPTGVVRESILHFNNIWRKSDGHEWEMGGARLKEPHLPTGPSSRSRSRSCHGQEEGGNWLAGSPELSMRGRSSSEGGTEHPATIGNEGSRQGWSQTGNAEQERSHLEGSGGGRDLKEEEPPSGPEFRSCAEIRRAWQEKERSALVTPKKGCRGPMNGGPPSPPEMAIYAEPLYIVEDSDLEDPPAPPVPKGDPEQTVGSKDGPDGEKGADEPPLPSLGLYGLPQEDPCLLETSERILSKVQALAKMYSEKIRLLKAPESPTERKKKPRVQPHPACGPRATSGSLATAQQEEGKPGANLPHCEPRIYSHVFIHEPFHHMVGVQEKTALVTATRGTALELRSARPPPLLPPDLLGPLRQEPPRHPLGFHSTTEETHPVPDLPGSPSPTLSAEHHTDLPPWAQDRGPPSGPRLAAEATLGDTQVEDMRWTTVFLDRETGEAGQLPHWPGIRPEASAAPGMPGLSLGSRPSPLGHEGPKACRLSGPVEEAKDFGPPASSAGSSSLQKPEGPPPLWPPCRPSHGEAGSQAKGEDPTERGGSRREEMTQEGPPREEPGGNRAEAPHGHPVPGPPKATMPPPPMLAAGAAVEPPPPPPPVVSAPGQRPSLPFPKLLPPSPVRRCLSSSAAALSRYIAASCISQSLAKRNGIPASEETQGTLQGFPPGGALADPLALLPKAAPRARGRGEVLGASLRPSSTRPPTAALAAAQSFEPLARLASASAPNSRAQSPSLVKPRLCSPPPPPPPPSGPPAHGFTPLGAHLLHRQLPSHVHSPVPLRPDQGRRAPATPPSPLDNGPPDSGLTHSPAANEDRGSSGHMPGLAPCPSAQDLGGLRWPEGPGFCLRDRNQEQGRLSPPLRPPLDGEGCPDPGSPPSGDGAHPADRSPLHPRASYSTTVNIQIGGSGRIASFSNAQVSLTTPEPLSLRKAHGSPREGTPKT